MVRICRQYRPIIKGSSTQGGSSVANVMRAVRIMYGGIYAFIRTMSECGISLKVLLNRDKLLIPRILKV